MTTPPVRGGVKIRKIRSKAQQLAKSKYTCPTCKKSNVARMQYGVWVCKSCKSTFAGGAWALNTAPGKESLRKLNLIAGNEE